MTRCCVRPKSVPTLATLTKLNFKRQPYWYASYQEAILFYNKCWFGSLESAKHFQRSDNCDPPLNTTKYANISIVELFSFLLTFIGEAEIIYTMGSTVDFGLPVTCTFKTYHLLSDDKLCPTLPVSGPPWLYSLHTWYFRLLHLAVLSPILEYDETSTWWSALSPWSRA